MNRLALFLTAVVIAFVPASSASSVVGEPEGRCFYVLNRPLICIDLTSATY